MTQISGDVPDPSAAPSSPADHAATVRLADLLTEAFDARDSILHAECLAEIVALADRATELEALLGGEKPSDEAIRYFQRLHGPPEADAPVNDLPMGGAIIAQLRAERERAVRAERERDEWKDSCLRERHALAHERERAIELETALRERDTLIARQLTPLDVAVTHIQIIRRKGDEYTAQERDNVAAIVEQHVTEARQTLFAALGETAPQISDEGMIQPHYRPGDLGETAP